MDETSPSRRIAVKGIRNTVVAPPKVIFVDRFKAPQGEPCEPCQKLEDVEDQITKVEAHLQRPTDIRRSLQRAKNKIHDPIIKLLPVEVVSHIFSLCRPDEDDLTPDMLYPGFQTSFPLALGAVSTAWRAIAWATPCLWASLFINADLRRNVLLPDLVAEWIARSGHLPLSIRLYCSARRRSESEFSWVLSRLVRLVERYATRWRVLDLSIPISCYSHFKPNSSEFRILEELRIKPAQLCLTRRPRIEDLNWKMTLSPKVVEISCLELQSLKITWNNVTHLSTVDPFLEQCFELLRIALQLISWKMSRINSPTEDTPYVNLSTPIIHHCLQTLDCRHMGTSELHFIDNIALPSLNELICRVEGGSLPLATISSLLMRSSCALKRLSIQVATTTGHDLMTLLDALPSLVDLELSFIVVEDFVNIWSRITEDVSGSANSFLPNLECIAYAGNKFSWHSFLQLLQGNFDLSSDKFSSARRPLLKITLLLEGIYEDFIDEDVLLALLDIQRNSGVKFDFNNISADHDILTMSMKYHGIMTEEG